MRGLGRRPDGSPHVPCERKHDECYYSNPYEGAPPRDGWVREDRRPPDRSAENRPSPCHEREIAPPAKLPQANGGNGCGEAVGEGANSDHLPSYMKLGKSLGSHRQDEGSDRKPAQQESENRDASRSRQLKQSPLLVGRPNEWLISCKRPSDNLRSFVAAGRLGRGRSAAPPAFVDCISGLASTHSTPGDSYHVATPRIVLSRPMPTA
jgi:hypothetical protein